MENDLITDLLGIILEQQQLIIGLLRDNINGRRIKAELGGQIYEVATRTERRINALRAKLEDSNE